MKKIKVIVNGDDSKTEIVGKVRRALLNDRQIVEAKAFDDEAMIALDSQSGFDINEIADLYVNLDIIAVVESGSEQYFGHQALK